MDNLAIIKSSDVDNQNSGVCYCLSFYNSIRFTS